MDSHLRLLDQSIQSAQNGVPEDLERWRTDAAAALRAAVGAESALAERFDALRYAPAEVVEGVDPAGYVAAGVRNGLKILREARRGLLGAGAGEASSPLNESEDASLRGMQNQLAAERAERQAELRRHQQQIDRLERANAALEKAIGRLKDCDAQ